MLIREFVRNLVMATKPHPRSLILYPREDIGKFYKAQPGLKEVLAVTSNKRRLTEFEITLKIFQIA
jgi:hypothetical protein